MGRLADWLEERVAYRERARAWLESPLAGGPRWAFVIGNLVGVCFAILAATGLLLMTVYAPSPQTAWSSVVYANDRLPLGWLVRGLHFWASDAMIVIAGAHVAKLVVTAAYRKPREVYYWLGLGIAGLVMAEAITGHLLPWDQRGWWARKVEFNILGLGPGGGFLQAMIQGGSEIGALALGRLFALHVAVLPLIFGALWLVRRHIVRRAAPAGAPAASANGTHGQQMARDAVGAVVLVAVLVGLAYRAHGAPIDAPADPLSDYPARPEWFLLPMFQLRHYFHGAGEFWGTVGLPTLFGLYLFALPMLDKKPGAKLGARAALLAPAVLVALGASALAATALRHDAADAAYQKQRAKADARAAAAVVLADKGVPPAGPLAMLANDPELRGAALFEKSCSSCHLLGDLGDPKKATASRLDGWGTEPWIKKMIHQPDADEYFGKTPYKGEMPSVDVPKEASKAGAMIKGSPEEVDDQLSAIALFLATQGDEPGERKAPVDEQKRAAGEKIVRETCTDCHAFAGDGDLEGANEAPELSRYGSIAWTTSQVANPAGASTYRDHAGDPHTKGLMPRFDGDLSPADVALVARWTRAKARGVPLVAP